MVVSKEYFILRVKAGVDAHWLVALLRTPAMRRIVEGTVTGTSNRTRVESVDVLMALPIPSVPPSDVQKAIGGQLRRAHSSHKRMITDISGAEAEAAKAGGLAVIDAPSEADVGEEG